jgi:glycerol-3-phosphate dehydrogenase subunit C
MREGSLDAPIRQPLPWQEPDFTDQASLDRELRRVFDVCHSCRRCFNLCDSFPRLFDLIDQSPSGELDSVKSEDFQAVNEACTLCDMCFMTKCPYVPPHPFNIDFPHLMLRHRAESLRAGKQHWADGELAKTDRNGKLGASISGLANWALRRGNALTRPLLQWIAGVHRQADLPEYRAKTFLDRAAEPVDLDRNAPAFGRKAVLYATCFVNYNNPAIGEATRKVLAKNGVATEVFYPRCCGMPLLEQGDLAAVAAHARAVATEAQSFLDRGMDLIALVPSCALMLKFEWPLLLPKDAAIERLAKSTYDISEYLVDIAKKEGLAPGLQPVPGGVALQIACHARAQNIGNKGAELIRLLPDTALTVIERCSGHGGAWGVKTKNFPVALKVGRPVAQSAVKSGMALIASECPLAARHVLQGMAEIAPDGQAPSQAFHPVEIIAKAYGLI